jgi:hypothetical protein
VSAAARPRPSGALLARWATAGAAVGVLVAAFLPWVVTGRAQRNSFDLLRAADRLDLLHGTVQRVAAVGWYLMPLAVGLIWLAAATGRRALVVVGGAIVGALAIALGVTVETSILRTEPGTPATIVLGGLTLVGAAMVALVTEESG